MSNYKIYKDNGSKYWIEFLGGEEKKMDREVFIKSLIEPQLLVGTSTNVHRNKLYFYADVVTTFADFLQKKKQNKGKSDMNTVINIIDCLSKQIFYLEARGYSFYKLTMDSILVIDDCRFIVIDRGLMLNLNNSIPKTIYFDVPVNKDGFISPELKNLSVLPSSIPYSSIYYSLGLVVLCYLNGSPLTEGGKEWALKQDQILNSIIDTKLFGFIKRCLHSNIEKRRMLFI
jgi:hypothetical protein